MRSDLVAVLSEGTLREYADECMLLLSRALPEEQRSDWADGLSKEAAQADEMSDAEAARPLARAVVAKLVRSATGIIDGTDREVEGVYNLLVALLLRYIGEGDEQFAPLVQHLVQVISDTQSSAAMERSVIKYRVLSNIFNMLSLSSALRLTVFEALLALASVNGDMDFLEMALKSLPTWLAQWDVSMEAKSACLGRVADALQANECGLEHVDKAYEFELLHLGFLSAEPTLPEDVRLSAAEKSIANVLRLPKLFEMEELLQVPVTLQLGTAPVLALLKVFVSGTRADLEEWLASSEGASTLERLALSADDLRHKMRLLDLASLCAQSVSAEVSYQDMAQVLDVPVDNVESWVIDVIRAGLVSGKLSQVAQTFRVYRSTYRTFDQAQWATLEQRLTQWQSSIQTLLTTMAEARAPVPQALQPDVAAEGSAPQA
ncbi:hypothetical protein MNAN1_000786 [Malassezia nana]|uniref:Eukaryotic translation initiation factor 3 subunit M n=1 Tax=Malassezia nana TaxID=180528 RepID=A0AAF0EJN5_9BASI|nr:hypothetical protein MNAN1_000786 [Malassezia nana]